MNFPEQIQKYKRGETTLEQFQQDIVSCTTYLQKEKLSYENSKKFVTELDISFQQINEKDFTDSTQEFFNFALTLCDKQIYPILVSQNFQFANIQKTLSANNLALTIFQFLLNDPKHVILCIQGQFSQTKTIEKRLTLLELTLQTIPKLSPLNVQFKQLLPQLLQNLNHSVEKYVKLRGKDNSESEKKVEKNFETWILGFLNRLVENFILLAKEGINEYSRDSAKYQVKFFIQLFFFDLSQGLIEFIPQEKLFETDKLKQFLDFLLEKSVSLFQNKYEIFDNLLEQISYQKYNDIEQPKYLQEYNENLRLNIVTTAYIYINSFQNSDLQSLYSDFYIKKTFLTIILEFFTFENAKGEMKKDLILIFTQIFKKSNQNLENLNHYGVKISDVLERIVNFSGGDLNKEDQEKVVESMRNCISSFSDNSQFRIFEEVLDKTDNLQCAAFFMDEFRRIMHSKIQDPEIKQENCYFLSYEKLSSFIKKLSVKGEISPLTERISLLQSCFLNYYFILKKANKQTDFPNSHILNYENIKKIQKESKDLIETVEKKIVQFRTSLQKERYDLQMKNDDKSVNFDQEETKIKSKEDQIAFLQFQLDQVQQVNKDLDGEMEIENKN